MESKLVLESDWWQSQWRGEKEFMSPFQRVKEGKRSQHMAEGCTEPKGPGEGEGEQLPCSLPCLQSWDTTGRPQVLVKCEHRT